MSWEVEFIVIVGVLFLLLAIGLPVAVCLGMIGFVGLWLLGSPRIAIDSIGLMFESIPRNFLFTAMPTFIFMSQLVMLSNITPDAFRGVSKFFAGFPAGLAIATLTVATGFAACSGASIASCAAIGPPAVKEMVERGYSKPLAIGCVEAGGGLAIIIPPSVALILYGFLTETSVAKLFMAGFVPGIIMAVGYMIIVLIWVWLRPGAAPHTPGVPLKERLSALLTMWPITLLAVIVLGSIYTGVATPTESACLGIIGALALTLAYRRFKLKAAIEGLLQTAVTTGYILFIVVGALTFGFLLSYLRLPQSLAAAIAGSGIGPLGMFLLVNILLLVLGCLMDTASLILVIIPIVAPILLKLGFDPVWLGLVLTINIEMGLTTPPIGLNIFVMQSVAAPFGGTYKDVVIGAVPFLLSPAAVIALLVVFPQLALWLPSRMG